MIPRNRPVISEKEIAARAGVPPTTWHRREAPTFREEVENLLPGFRTRAYDEAQADAYVARRFQGLRVPIPPLPTEPHPEDRLTVTEVAEILGIEPQTVHSYAQRGDLAQGQRLRGPDGEVRIPGVLVWARRDVDHRVHHAPGQAVGAGRPTKVHPYAGDPRLEVAAAALVDAPDASTYSIAARLARIHGGATSTWTPIINVARARHHPVTKAPYAGDPRLEVAAAALVDAPDAPISSIAADLARIHGGATSTWIWIINVARAHPPAQR